MLELISCTCCNKTLGDHIDLYNIFQKKIKTSYLQNKIPKVSIDRVQWDPKFDLKFGKLLDILHINNECCRSAMLSKVKISELK